MVVYPRYEDYDIKALVFLGNRVDNIFTRNKIKLTIVNKIVELNKPMFFLINMFIKSDNILKEAYAKVILIRLKNEDFLIEDNVIDEILSLVSKEDLAIYGSEAISSQIRDKCTKIFWDNAVIFEDISELGRKSSKYRKRELFNKLKRKGD